MRQRGFLHLSVTGYVMLALGVVLALALVAVKVQSSRLASVKAEYAAFVAQTKAIGEEQERKTKEAIKQQERKSSERIKSLETRLANTRREFDRLRNSPGRRELPPVPPSSRPVDDAASDQRLLDLLQHAQETADRLIELQEWVRQQGN